MLYFQFLTTFSNNKLNSLYILF